MSCTTSSKATWHYFSTKKKHVTSFASLLFYSIKNCEIDNRIDHFSYFLWLVISFDLLSQLLTLFLSFLRKIFVLEIPFLHEDLFDFYSVVKVIIALHFHMGAWPWPFNSVTFLKVTLKETTSDICLQCFSYYFTVCLLNQFCIKTSPDSLTQETLLLSQNNQENRLTLSRILLHIKGPRAHNTCLVSALICFTTGKFKYLFLRYWKKLLVFH